MAEPPGDKETDLGGGRDAFVEQLSTRLAAIEDIWSKLESGAWDRELLDALYARIREISESSKSYNLFQLNESVFSLEVYLSSFVDSDIVPGASQMSAIAGLVRALKTAASVTASTELTAGGDADEAGIFILGDSDGPTGDVTTALSELGCDVSLFGDTEALLARLQVRPPKVIVADTAALPGIGPLSDELVRLRSHMSLHIPLIFVSRSTTLQLRVDAIRAGGDGYLVAPLDAQQVAMQIRDMAAPDSETPSRVLIVEDDPTQADFAASILHKAGIEVLQVTEPIKVIDALRDFRPDLILMDIYMPEVNGIELTTIIRDHQEFVAIPIVFLSGEQNTEKQLDALSVGGDDFVAKPIRPKHLLSIVQTRIRRSRQILSATGKPPKHDRVTGLFSRQLFLDRVAAAIDDEVRGGSAGVLMVRPDNAEELNAALGAGGMDHLMSKLGELIAAQLDDTDVAARVDERSFGVLARREQREALIGLAETLIRQIDDAGLDDKVSLHASVGLCVIDDRLENANGIIARATAACGDAAIHGGQRVHVHSAEADSQEISTQPDDDLPQRVKNALRDDAFIIQYQPLLDLQTRGSETYEIVLRVENAQGDLVGDRVLLEAAEKTDSCEELDHWILERAINILKQRRDGGRRTRVFVHQSSRSALNADMPAWLLGRLRAKQMVGTGLVVDFRLPDLSLDLKTAQQNIRALREMDVEVSLSRFPEKEAAFKVLNYLRANYINITPRLLKADRHVISSVIRQAHDASAKVIVSNVDDPRSIDLHWSSGADFLQGNFIQRPLENMDYDFTQVVI
ncbi:MAG: EAL domain-containing protein [Gammaproteobacteria bacterium]|nr:EAL domain-containing protein [Gammaproteobacteria bacterium]